MKLHSIVGLITNSSTEIYTYPVDNAVEKAKELLAQCLEPEISVDDSFRITLDVDESYFNDALDWLPETAYNEGLITEEEMNAFYDSLHKTKTLLSKERMEEIVDICRKIYAEQENKKRYAELHISILPGTKISKEIDIVNLVQSLHITEEMYN
jgi:hypothetical protein